MGGMFETLDTSHIKLLRDLQKDLESHSIEMTEKELLKALIEFVVERKRVFINSLVPPDEKRPLERWLEKIVAQESSEKKEKYTSG